MVPSINVKNPISKLILASIPEIIVTIEQLLAPGTSKDEVVKVVAQIVDDLLDWPAVLKGSPFAFLAPVLEMGDGPLLTLAVKAIVNAVVKTKGAKG